MSSQQIALLGGDSKGRQALLNALAPRLQGTPFVAEAVELGAEMQSPALVLLLASATPQSEDEELHWRQRLMQAGIAFSVLHGDAQARLDGAWRLIEPLLGLAPSPDARSGSSAARWTWTCDKCSDPACEHRLFQDLVQGRRDAGPGSEGY